MRALRVLCCLPEDLFFRLAPQLAFTIQPNIATSENLCHGTSPYTATNAVSTSYKKIVERKEW
jgi:hypothetical protein